MRLWRFELLMILCALLSAFIYYSILNRNASVPHGKVTDTLLFSSVVTFSVMYVSAGFILRLILPHSYWILPVLSVFFSTTVLTAAMFIIKYGTASISMEMCFNPYFIPGIGLMWLLTSALPLFLLGFMLRRWWNG